MAVSCLPDIRPDIELYTTYLQILYNIKTEINTYVHKQQLYHTGDIMIKHWYNSHLLTYTILYSLHTGNIILYVLKYKVPTVLHNTLWTFYFLLYIRYLLLLYITLTIILPYIHAS